MKKKKIVPKMAHCEYSITRIVCLSMIGGILVTGMALFATRGKLLSDIFWWDPYDTGMDFFHSIEYVHGRVPYEHWETLYPPLANFLFYILFRLVPKDVTRWWADNFENSKKARGTWSDLRVTQSTAFLFIVFILVTGVAMVGLIQAYLGYSARSFVAGAALLFSYGMLYAYERGNIIIAALFFSMFFVFFKDSPNKMISELALISLAIAAGLKLYPAFFGFLLLYDKQYAKALRAVIYGIAFFVIPVFAFQEGLYGIKLFFDAYLKFSSSETLALAADGYSLTQIMSSVLLVLHNGLHIAVNEGFWLNFMPKIGFVCLLTLLLCGFGLKKNWQRALTCCVAILLFSFQNKYAVALLLIPLLVMMKEEKYLRRDNIVPLVFLLLSQTLLPVWGKIFDFWFLMDLRFQICLIALAVYIIQNVLRNKDILKQWVPAKRR